MAVVKTVHLGGIVKDDQLIKTFAAPSRTELISELNDWLFDYCYANSKDIQLLPPLDDWHQSEEDATFWSISHFTKDQWTIWIRHELMEFR